MTRLPTDLTIELNSVLAPKTHFTQQKMEYGKFTQHAPLF